MISVDRGISRKKGKKEEKQNCRQPTPSSDPFRADDLMGYVRRLHAEARTAAEDSSGILMISLLLYSAFFII